MKTILVIMLFIFSPALYSDSHIKIIQHEVDGVKIDIIEASISDSRIKIVTPNSLTLSDDSGYSYSGFSLDEFLNFSGAQVVHSGGFLSSFQPPYPLGYLRVNNKDINRKHNSWLVDGVFCTKEGSLIISNIDEIDDYSNWNDCLQSGPILLKNGLIALKDTEKINKLKNRKYAQSFICRDDNDHFYMGVSEKLKLTDIVKYLVRPKSKNGLGCIDAINLPGARSAGMMVNTESTPQLQIFGNIDLLQSNSITVN